MPRGTPDGNASPYGYASQETDLGAIYQMLLGFSPLNSQGRVMYFDTFKNGLGGFTFSTGGAGSLAPYIFSQSLTGLIYTPPGAVLMVAGTTTGISNVILRRTSYLGVNKRLGVEVGFSFTDTSPNYRFQVEYRESINKNNAMRLQWNRASGAWQILTPTGTPDIFIPGVPPTGDPMLLQIKLVGDWETGKYVRALIGDRIIDLSAYNMAVASIGYDGFRTDFIQAVSNNGASTGPGHIGYVLMTKDEP